MPEVADFLPPGLHNRSSWLEKFHHLMDIALFAQGLVATEADVQRLYEALTKLVDHSFGSSDLDSDKRFCLPALFACTRHLVHSLDDFVNLCEAMPALLAFLPHTTEVGPLGYDHFFDVSAVKERAQQATTLQAFFSACGIIPPKPTKRRERSAARRYRDVLSDLLDTSNLALQHYVHVCQFLTRAGNRATVAAEVLPLLVGRLPDTLRAAKARPGRQWEDRNWSVYKPSQEEQLARAMSDAVLALCDRSYSREEWRLIANWFRGLGSPDLSHIELAQVDIYGPPRYVVKDLTPLLRQRLRELNDPAIDRALERPQSHSTLKPVWRILERDAK